MSSEADRLIEQGDLAGAADLLLRQGEPARAADLLEQVWDYRGAAQAALQAGDVTRALEDAVRAEDRELQEEAITRLLESSVGDPSRLHHAAKACQTRGAWSLAARLLLAAKDPAGAARCLDRAGRLLDAGRALEQAGQLTEAIERYRRFIFEAGEARDATGPEDAEACQARLALGKLLLRHGRPDEALPHLQRAWHETTGLESRQAGRAVAAGLHWLGYAHAAREALHLLHASADATAPAPTLEEILSDASLAPVEEADGGGRVLAGRYQLGDLLGAGGMGSVYLAQDLLNQRDVAVKVFTAPPGDRGRDAFLRFSREARAMGFLHHPHVVSLLDFNEELGFLVLEYMAGETLAQRLDQALPLPACQEVLLQLISGLAAAHQRGIIHRDIKPSNIFFSAAGAVKLGDFGVAHLQDSGQTQTGAFIGTLAYMSPEQISGSDLTFACDVYALGVLTYRMVTGALPFSPPDLVGKHLGAQPPRPSEVCPGLPLAYDELVLRAMAKRPEERHASLEALRRAVAALPVEVDGHQAVTRDRAAKQDHTDRPDGGQRYRGHGLMAQASDGVRLLHAEDSHLGREVQLVEAPPGHGRDRALGLLQAAARVEDGRGAEHLQAVLDLKPERGLGVLSRPPSLQRNPDAGPGGLDLLRQLALALEPLHRAGVAHGALDDPGAVALDGPTAILLLGPALLAAHGPEPATLVHDLAHLARRCGVTLPTTVTHAQELAAWADGELKLRQEKQREQRREALYRQEMALKG